MPPCPAGSHIKPAMEPAQWVIPTALCAPIALLDGWSPWLDIMCSQIAPTLVRIDELCTSPPPPYPEIDPVKLAEQGQLYIWNKNLSDWVWAAWVNANWAVLCECNPVTGPGPCPAIAPVSGTITGHVFSAATVVATLNIGHNWTAINGKVSAPAGNTAPVVGSLDFLDAANVQLATFSSPTVAPGQSLSWTVNSGNMNATQRANVRKLRFMGRNNSTPSITQTASIQVDTYTGPCTVDTTTIPPPPDPYPDPPPPDAPPPPPLPTTGCTTDELCQMLYEVLRQLQHTGQLVTLLQRYGLPFASIPGPMHGPLTGSGQFAVSGLVGIRVDITSSLPPRQLEGTPPYVWDLGWMSIMTGDGMIEEIRITRDTQVWQPRMIQEATLYGYYFKSGVAATVTELQPEPY